MSNEIKVIIEQNRAISESVQIQTFNYDNVKNKPSINGVELVGDKTGADLGIEIDTSKFPTREELDKKADKTEIPDVSDFALKSEIPDVSDFALKREIPTKNSQLDNDSDFVNSEYVTQGLATKQDKGDYATNTRVNQVEASIPQAYDDTEIRTLIDNVEETSEQAKAIAEGKATGYVFDTVEDMNAWVGTNSSILKLGDNLYIRAVNVPDYWWDGEKAQQLETQKVDLSEYVKNTDYATGSKAGIAKINLAYGININNQTLTIFKATDNEVKGKGNLYRPIVPANLDLAVKTGVTTNTLELTDDEKTSARTWLGAVGNTDYATKDTYGVVKVDPTGVHGIGMNESAGLYAVSATEQQISAKINSNRIISPRVLDYAVKTSVTTNTIELTDDEKTSARTWLGAVGNTDYATSTKGGVIKAQPTYGLVQYSGILQGQTRNLASYNSAMNSFVVCKGTLDNVLTQYSKTVLTTEADYNALATKDANTLYLIEE